MVSVHSNKTLQWKDSHVFPRKGDRWVVFSPAKCPFKQNLTAQGFIRLELMKRSIGWCGCLVTFPRKPLQ